MANERLVTSGVPFWDHLGHPFSVIFYVTSQIFLEVRASTLLYFSLGKFGGQARGELKGVCFGGRGGALRCPRGGPWAEKDDAIGVRGARGVTEEVIFWAGARACAGMNSSARTPKPPQGVNDGENLYVVQGNGLFHIAWQTNT